MTTRLSDEARREFLAEADEIVEALFSGFARVDEQRQSGRINPALMNEVFRAAHSLKGLAGMFGLSEVTQLAHEMESVLDALRLGKRDLDLDLMRLLYRVCDVFRRMLTAVRAGDELDRKNIEPVLEELRSSARSGAAVSPSDIASMLTLAPDALSVLTEYEEHRLVENLRAQTAIYKVHAPLTIDAFEAALAELSTTIGEVGEVITTLPSADGDGSGINFDVVFAAPLEEVAVVSMIVALNEIYTVTRVDRPTQERSAPRKPDAEDLPATSMRQVSDTVRVDIQKLDELMSIVGELVLTRGGLTRVSDELKTEMGFRGHAVDLHRLARTMERRILDLQNGLMQVRMVPLGQVFERLGRVARRTASELDKDVVLEVQGEDTELDKLLVEQLVDPLMHIVRNAVDHGIGTMAAREALGKPPHGTLKLRAFPRGNHVVVEVQDDGKGIDEVSVKRAALERGVVDEDRIGTLSRHDVLNLIFHAGLSTRREADETSGRGVGLDVVKHNIAAMSGIIEVNSVPGGGTTFAITLPITLAIIQALIVRSRGHIFALPLASVLEILAVDDESLHHVEGKEMLELRGRTVPVLRLAQTFELETIAGRPQDESELGFAAVVGLAQHRVALFVDDVIGQQDIVIKSLGAYLQNVSGIAGATHMGDHETILVLDVAALIQELQTPNHERTIFRGRARL